MTLSLKNCSSKIIVAALCLASIVSTVEASSQVYDYSHSEAMFFTEEAVAHGVDSPGYGRGAAMTDLNNDGLLDLVVTTAGLEDQFFRQKLDGTFELMNNSWSMPPHRDESWGVICADFDNDGDQDIYFVNGGFSGAEVNVLLRNDINVSGKFVDVSASSGACSLIVSNFGGTAFDYDNDGDLDLFLTSSIGTGSVRPPCEFYRNDGNLQFTDMAAVAGIIHAGDFRNCSSADYDNDGYMDVVVGNFDSFNILYRNNGDGTFSDTALTAGVRDPYRSFGATFEDFNNDGWPDLFVPKYEFTGGNASSFFINNKNGTFRENTAFASMTSQGDMGHNTGDINADGFPDILIGTGHPYWERADLVKVMFPTRYNDSMAGREAASYLGLDAVGPSRSHGYALGDIDNDGDVDIYNNNGGPSQFVGTWGSNALYLAQGNNANWLKLDLEGVESNRDGVGARVRTDANDGRSVWRYRTAGKGFCNTDSPILHFGLGFATNTNLTEVFWPSGIVQSFVRLPLQQTHSIAESGIGFTGTPTVGGQVTINAIGPRDGRIELLYSSTEVFNPDPVNHWVDRLGGVPFYIGSSNLNSNGRESIVFDIPNDAALSGTSLFVQGTVSDVQTPSNMVVKTNVIELQIP
ncbi:MAG: CRTAC1 family protein [Planctomycetota bacterium]|jgi:hypothetical protein|nr:CRTAC1 family protein [Planctomycetota bacterium]